MILPYFKIDRVSVVCRKCSDINCNRERKWNKKKLKPHLSRSRIKKWEEDIIKEQLEEGINKMEEVICDKCKSVIDCECMDCHKCHPEATCDTCGLCHIDGWEASACWSMENDPDYDPFDI